MEIDEPPQFLTLRTPRTRQKNDPSRVPCLGWQSKDENPEYSGLTTRIRLDQMGPQNSRSTAPWNCRKWPRTWWPPRRCFLPGFGGSIGGQGAGGGAGERGSQPSRGSRNDPVEALWVKIQIVPRVNIRFNPTTKIGSKMGGAPKTPQNGAIGFDPQLFEGALCKCWHPSAAHGRD